MALNLIPPGTRKGNRHWVVRGRVNGVLYEGSTGTTDEKAAIRFKKDLEQKLKVVPITNPRRLSFADAVERYRVSKRLAKYDEDRLQEWVKALGTRRAIELLPADFHDVANHRHSGHTAGTKNRFMRPAVAAWHYVAKLGLIPYVPVMMFTEAAPRTRAVDAATAASMIHEARDDDQRRLLVWLFHQGTRISATLRLRWEDIDLDAAIAMVDVRKGQPPRRVALHPVVLDELQRVPSAHRYGKLFRWSDRSSLRRWLPKVAEAAGVTFTPHMARHTVGTLLALEGAGQRQIMETLGHLNEKSSLRYQAGGVEMARSAHSKLKIVPARKAGKRST